MEKINRTNIADHLLDYQLKLIGRERLDLLSDDRWFFNWTITKKQKEEFLKYSVPLLKKIFKCNTTKAKDIFNWFDSTFGLRLKG